MKIQPFFRVLLILVVIDICSINVLFSQSSGSGPVHQSIPSMRFNTQGNVPLHLAERARITNDVFESLRQVNEKAHEQADPGWLSRGVDFVGGVANNILDEAIDKLPLLSGSVLGQAKDYLVDQIFDNESEAYRQQRAFEVRQEIERAMTEGVNLCTGDINCIDRLANELVSNPEIKSQFKEAGDLGIFDAAHTRALIKSVKDEAVANYTGTVIKIDNLDVKISGIVNDVKTTMVAGFQTMNNNQRTIINGVSTLIDIEQRQAIALNNIQTTLNENFTQIGIGINNINELQQINMFISTTTLEAVGVIDQKVDVLNENINVVSLQIKDLTATIQEMRVEQRNEKIQEIFNNSPLGLKITQLQNANSTISQLLLKQEGGAQKRQQLILNFKSLKSKEDVIIATKMIATWGNVGKQALATFCTDCPEELTQGINAAITASNIAGNIASGNIAGAVMSVLGIFKKPEPSPELKMLQQVSRQIKELESKMNAQFNEVHNHLFAIERNLGNRMEIIDSKVEQLTQFVLAAHVQVMEQLSGIDLKLNYVINQNECTKDLILTLTQQAGQDLCKEPVSEFKNRASNSQIRNFKDLDNFFRGNVCQPCIKALFDASNISLINNASFRYAQCNIEGADNKARPDRAYEFIFKNFISENADDSLFVNSLLLIPANVKVAASFPDSVRTFLNRSMLTLNEEDRNFRNHRAIIAYADYLLTMFTMIEYFDNNRLVTPAEINRNPGFSRERARKMILILEGVLDLLNHSMFQQSVLAGNGMFPKLDKLIKDGVNAVPEMNAANFNVADMFTYNPYLSKNYAAYLIDKHIGLNRLKDIIDNKRLKNGKQRIAINGANILLFTNENESVGFAISLTDLDPEKHIPLMQGFLPFKNNKVDEELYKRNMAFIFPTAYLELQSMKDRIIGKLAEMRLIVSPGLDANNGGLSRRDLKRLVGASKN